MSHTNKISTQKLINEIMKKINRVFVTKEIIQNTNEKAKRSAANLWYPLEAKEIETHELCNQVAIQSYNNLVETLSSLLKDNKL